MHATLRTGGAFMGIRIPKLGKHQRVLMMHLAQAGTAGCSVIELNQDLPPSTVRLGLAGLIGRGYASRTQDPTNMRGHRYYIRQAGIEWVAAIGGNDAQV